ncbi:glycosyltransferase [uncultured Sphingobacterium sp.]|uniref:glycosyltransferase family 2 protein n=1 Tax=uncultured Sphingobacterium sp. TaxID=182688 RepID=UPI0025F9A1F6|nr:glycosyltransferase [uncultured Sphingobacterium sp.]
MADSILIVQFATTQDGTSGQHEILKIKDFENNPDNPLFLYIDGSTDNTAKIINNFNDNRIKLYRNKANRGITASLNKALALSRGIYVARIDADDMMHPERISIQVQFLEAGENIQIVLVGSHHYVINKAGALVSFKQYPISDHEITSVYAFQNPFSHPTTMIRAHIVKQIGYSDQYPHAEDYHLWGQILKQFKAANIPEYLTYYRIHEQNTSNENGKIQRENAASVMHDELNYLGIEPTVEELKVHLALAQGLGRRYFNDENKIDKLRAWIDKICTSHQIIYKLPKRQHKATKNYVLHNICNIY